MKQMHLHESETILLGDLCDIVIGRTPKREKLDNFGGNHIWVSIGDMNDKYIEDSKEKLTDKGVKEANARLIPEGTLLLSFKLSLGKVAITRRPLYTNEAIAALIPRKRVNVNYLYYHLRQIDFSRYGRKAVKGLCLNKEILSKIEIELVPPETQDKIVSILEKAEQLKQWRSESDRLANDFLNSLFVKIFGDPKTNPKKLETARLGQFVYSVTSGSRGWKRYYTDSGARFIRVQNLTGYGLDLSEIAHVDAPEDAESKRTLVKTGDVLVSITGEVGLSAVVPDDLGEAYVSQHVACVRLTDSMNPYYVAAFIGLPTGGQTQFASMQYGQTRPGLNLNQIKSLRIMVPPLDMQNKFAAIIEQIEQMKSSQRGSRQLIDNLFDASMQEVSRGGVAC